MDINFSDSLINQKNKKDIVNIILDPKSQAFFVTNGIKFENSNSLLGVKGHENIVLGSKKITDLLRDKWSYEDKLGLSHSYEKTLFFHIKFYINYLLLCSYLIDQAIIKYRPKRIFFNSENLKNSSYYQKFEGNFFEQILIDFIRSSKFKIDLVDSNNSKNSRKLINNLREITLNKILNLQSLRRFHNFFITHIIVIRNFLFRKKNIILFADDSYNMGILLEKIKSKHNNVLPVYLNIGRESYKTHIKNFFLGRELFFLREVSKGKISSGLNSSIKSLESFLEDNPIYPDIHSSRINIAKYIKLFVSNRISCELEEVERNAKNISLIQRRVRPKLAISQHSVGYSYALGEIFNKESIPALLISHGTHTLHKKNTYDFLEWDAHSKTIFKAHYLYSSIQSPMALDAFKSFSGNSSQALVTGPILFSLPVDSQQKIILEKNRLLGESNSGKKVVIHASSPKSSIRMRPWIYETNDEYIRHINDLIDAVDNIPNTYLIIRFRPTEEISLKVFKKLLKKSKNMGIYHEGSFYDYLKISDLLVSYSSTTIEEALINKVPVLQYDHDGKYRHIEAPKITSISAGLNPIYFCNNCKNLKNSVEYILQNIESIRADNKSWDLYSYKIDYEINWLSELL